MVMEVLLGRGHEGCRLLVHFYGVPLVTFSSAEKTPVVKHIFTAGIQGPIVTLPRVPRLPGDFYEAVIQGKVVSNAVLPSWKFFTVIRETVNDKFTNS